MVRRSIAAASPLVRLAPVGGLARNLGAALVVAEYYTLRRPYSVSFWMTT